MGIYGIKIIKNIFDIFYLFDNVYFLYGSKFSNPTKKLDYIKKNINIKNIIPIKCKKIEDVIDENIKKIINKPDLQVLDSYNGFFKLKIKNLLNKYSNNLKKRINNNYQYGR